MTDFNAPVTEDELHAFVDGELPADRQDAVAAWLAAHPSEAATVAAWRAQAEAIRARFGAVAQEPVPARLKLEQIMRQSGAGRRSLAAFAARPRLPPSSSAAASAGLRAEHPRRRAASARSRPTRSTPINST